MRLLHITSLVDLATGGPAEGLRNYCATYASFGYEVEVVSFDDPASVADQNFPVPLHPMGPARGVFGYTPRMIPWLRANLHRFDLVLVNGVWNFNTMAAARVLAGSGKPYAIFTHGMLDPYFKHAFPLKHIKKLFFWHLFLAGFFNRANAVFFTSEEEKILARQSFGNYHVREQVIPYGTYGPKCDLAAARDQFLARFPELAGKRLALFLSRIHPKKGTDLLVESFARTLAKDPAWQLVLAGPDQIGWQSELTEKARQLGIAERITWTGMLKDELKWGAFAASECFVLPSHQENFGIVVAEALACNLPVITTDKVNIWREIKAANAGLIGHDTLEATTQLLAQWQQLSDAERETMRQQARRCFDENFYYQSTRNRIAEIYQGLVNQPVVNL